MLDVFFQMNLFFQFIEISVDSNPYIARTAKTLQKFFVHSFLSAHHRRKKLHLRSFLFPHEKIYHLIYCLLLDFSSANRAMRDSHPRIKKTHIIINLRYSSDCGSGIPIGRLLVNGNGRRKSFYELHIRFLHLSKELPCVRRKGLHVPTLSLGVDCIKSKRRLSRTRKAGQNHQRISWNIEINML